MVKCDFCKLVKKRLNKGDLIFDTKVQTYEFYKDTFVIKEAVGMCRGFNLCAKHIKLIKKDNKLRISRGQEIPNNLKLIKKFTRHDI